MTPADRMELKLAVHHRSLSMALAWIEAHGTPDCDECGCLIEQRPRKRFCSMKCRTRHDDRTTTRARRLVNRSYHHKVAA